MSELSMSQRFRILREASDDGLTDDGGFVFNGFFITPNMVEAIRGYVDHGYMVGGFLSAVLENDLRKAVVRADGHNVRNLPAYIAYLNNYVPAPCWGSKKAVEDWRARKDAERRRT